MVRWKGREGEGETGGQGWRLGCGVALVPLSVQPQGRTGRGNLWKALPFSGGKILAQISKLSEHKWGKQSVVSWPIKPGREVGPQDEAGEGWEKQGVL